MLRNVDPMSHSVNVNPTRHFIDQVENKCMTNEWAKRPLFLQWVEDAKQRLSQAGGKGTNVEVAQVMGLAPNSIRKYLSKVPSKHRPGTDALRRLGEYLERDYRLLLDGPDQAPEGISPAKWVETDEETRMFNNTMFSMTEGMTREQRKTIIEMIKLGQAIGKARRQKP